jgi:hypothetical protein
MPRPSLLVDDGAVPNPLAYVGPPRQPHFAVARQTSANRSPSPQPGYALIEQPPYAVTVRQPAYSPTEQLACNPVPQQGYISDQLAYTPIIPNAYLPSRQSYVSAHHPTTYLPPTQSAYVFQQQTPLSNLPSYLLPTILYTSQAPSPAFQNGPPLSYAPTQQPSIWPATYFPQAGSAPAPYSLPLASPYTSAAPSPVPWGYDTDAPAYINQDTSIPGQNFRMISNKKPPVRAAPTNQAAQYAHQFGPGGQYRQEQYQQQQDQQYQQYPEQDAQFAYNAPEGGQQAQYQGAAQQYEQQPQGDQGGYPQNGYGQQQEITQHQNEEYHHHSRTQYHHSYRQEVTQQRTTTYTSQPQQQTRGHPPPAQGKAQSQVDIPQETPSGQPHLSWQQKDEKARKVFMQYDKDGNGFLDIYEFLQAMNHLGANLSFAEAQPIFDSFDDDHEGTISIEEFANNYCANY